MGKKYYIESLLGGRVLDIKDGRVEAGAEVILWSKSGGDNQLWKFKDGVLKSVADKELALDIDIGNNRLIVWKVHGKANQKWKFNDDNTLESETGKVVDVASSNDADGAKLVPYSKHGGRNQQFKLVEK